MPLLPEAQPALVFTPEDTISRVAATMLKERRSEALIVDGEKVHIIHATDLLERHTNDVNEMKIGSLKLPVREVCDADTPPEKLIEYILAHNVRAVPLLHNKTYYTVSKLTLLKFVSKQDLKGKTAADVLFYPYTLSPTDTIVTAQSMIRDHQLPRAVVLDKEKFVGVVDALDLLHVIIERQRSKRGDLAGEKTTLNVLASSPAFLRNIPVVKPAQALGEVVSMMLKTDAYTVAVQDETEFFGLLTPTNILKLTSQRVEGVYVNISGEGKEDAFTRGLVDDEVKRELRKLAKVLPIDYLAIHIKRHHESGKRVKYGLHARLITGKGMFFAQDDGWDLAPVMRGVLGKLEREVERKRGKERRR